MIILDMDGVLADFNRGAAQAHGREYVEPTKWNYFEEWGMTAAEFWGGIHRWGDAFYRYMVPPYPWKDDVLRMVGEADDFVIMSSPSNDPAGYAAKKIWCDKHAPGIKLIVGSEKHLLAGPDRLLIDDYGNNIIKFANAGGHTLIFPQLWNSNRVLAETDSRLSFLQRELNRWAVELSEPARVA